MPDVKLSLPVDAADDLAGILGVPLPTQGTAPQNIDPSTSPMPGTVFPQIGPPVNPAQSAAQGPMPAPALPLSTGPLAASAPPPMPADNSALGTIPSTSGTPTRPPQSTLGKVGGVLGKIGGYALSALAPGIAAEIPSTPLGKIAQQQRELGAEQIRSEDELRRAQASEAEGRRQLTEAQAKQIGTMVRVVLPDGREVWLNEKDASSILGKEAQGQTSRDVAAGKETSAEKIAGGKETSAEKIAGGKNLTQEDVAKQRVASQERIAKAHDLANTEIARIRAASADDPNKLTNTMKTMKQQAQSTLPGIDKALDETEKVANLLGPGEGRWNDFWQGKVGVSDPKYAHYKDEIAMVSTAVTLAHARGRMSNELFEEFQRMFDVGKQSADNMIQALNVAHEWLDGYAKMGESNKSDGGSQGGKVPSFKDWKSGQPQ